ncbi:glycosyltransferase family 2 protein [Candidatus Wolfebacteria bacterium]|nr:glycosyltransferase family 2 protein [Candidatus Wolfebacteria bacterium]
MEKNSAGKIILSICIPTCNQPDELRRTLESLTSQMSPDVEIVIRDDSADGKSAKVAGEFQNKISIRYFHGKKEGVDVAIIFLTEEAKGKYVWWLGDDVVFPGTVEKFIKVVKEFPDITFLYMNSADYEGNQAAISSIKGSGFFKNGDEVVEKIAGFLGFCSATLFLREQVLLGISSAKKHIGTSWVTLYLAMYVVSRGGRLYFLDGQNFWSNPKSANIQTWYEPFQVFAVNFYYIVNEFKNYFSNKSLKIMLAKNFASVWRSILVYRAKDYKTGYGSDSPKLKIISKLYWSFPEFWIAFPMLLLPKSAVKIFYKIYKLIFKKIKNRY